MNNENNIITATNLITTLDQAHPRVSAKYQVVPTKMIADKFFTLGFKVDEYKSVRVRDASRIGYQKHFVRLSHPTLLTTKHNDVKLQLLVTNSHDGSSSFSIKLGIFRLVCSNGLVVGTTFESVTLRHTGRILEEIDGAVERMVAQTKKLDDALERMKSRTMTTEEIAKFYNEAVKIRYGNTYTNSDVEVTSRRTADDASDLFTVYNRVQEALIRGSQARGGNGRFRQRRAITNINKDLTINEKLFDLAYSYVGEAIAA
jgi:hypothetical protein